MKRTIFPSSFLAAVAMLSAASASHAEGLSIGGSLGTARQNGDAMLGGYPAERSKVGGKLYGGYSFTPNFSLEAGYADLGRIKSDAGRLRADGFFVDAVGTFPLGNDFSLLGRVGVFDGRLRRDLNGSQTDGSTSGSERGTSYKVGAGMQYDFNKNTALRAEWEHYRFDALDSTPHTNLLSVGVNYKF
ncbi:MAG TPA: porin family protein [Burkholderiaceae bacterium]|nr:porin family protein [Burkholderiaceae bacterium]